jgi:TetR/AcrR family transcriptional repressor of mexJK operon
MNKTLYPDSIAAWRLIVGESGRFPELGRIFYEQAAKHVEGALCGYLESQIAAGFLRDEGAKKMAQVLLGICGSQQNRWIWGIEPFGKAELRADAALFAAYFLRLFKTE